MAQGEKGGDKKTAKKPDKLKGSYLRTVTGVIKTTLTEAIVLCISLLDQTIIDTVKLATKISG